MAQILNGIRIRDEILRECEPRVEALKAARCLPGLAVILVGHNPASEIYVRNKVKACQKLGVYSEMLTPPESITTEGLLELIAGLNSRPEIDGILVQLPLPKHVDTRRVLVAVDPAAEGALELVLGVNAVGNHRRLARCVVSNNFRSSNIGHAQASIRTNG